MDNANLDKKAIQASIKAFCETKNISRKEFAFKADVSPATISNILNDKWDNINDKLWRQVENAANSGNTDNLMPTRDCNKVFKMCEIAQKSHKMFGLAADTGMGKTTALTAYMARPNVFYYYIDATITPKVFLKDLLRELGVSFEGNLNEMLQRICLELNIIENPLLIVDECAKLSDKMMLYIHSIRDRTINNCGIVLAGMPDFKNRLIKYANKGKTGYGEFFRRVNDWFDLDGLTTGEINGILRYYGIDDPIEQKDFRNSKKFGDLKNDIDRYLNND